MINAYHAALMCDRSYKDATVERDNHQALVEMWDGKIVMSPRGTERDLEDIWTDMRAWPRWSRDLGCWCHGGFLDGAETLFDGLRQYTLDAQHIHMVGHSLGGAIALILAGLFKRRLGITVEGIITYGCPRPAFGGLEKALVGIQIHRWVNAGDIFVRHPWPVWGYRHRGMTRNTHGVPMGGFIDHKLSRYTGSLQRLYGKRGASPYEAPLPYAPEPRIRPEASL